MSLPLTDALNQVQTQINSHLQQLLLTHPGVDQRLQQAMEHTLLLGGKRIRPFLVYVVGEMLGADTKLLHKAAMAIELIHTYSLVHDDLPAMDDDELRRGHPTCHIAFDEATAILAGDALQSLAFELLSEPLEQNDAPWQLKMIHTLASASGHQGMCGGQALDLAATDKTIALAELEQLHQHKTGKLIHCAIELARLAAHNDDPATIDALNRYASAIGLAFQIQDDILDLTGDTATLGKPQGSDSALNKSTYPALLGLDGAINKAQQLHHEAVQALSNLPYNSPSHPGQHSHSLLAEFARYIVERNK